jgi:hypothetical protein
MTGTNLRVALQALTDYRRFFFPCHLSRWCIHSEKRQTFFMNQFSRQLTVRMRLISLSQILFKFRCGKTLIAVAA